MDEVGVEAEAIVFREVSIDGVTLTIVASQSSKGAWQLSVQNEFGTSTNWHELFTDARQAIDAGMSAIDEEGIESFMDMEGYEYLF